MLKRLTIIFQRFLPILALSLIPTLAVWAPFFLGAEQVLGIPIPTGGMGTIVKNYDGPLYIVVAKTLYNTQAISQSFSFNLPVEYYAAHFPLFPLLIRGASLVAGWYPYSMLFVTTITSVLCMWFFYRFARDFIDKKNALLITAVFAIFPARWLIVRSVGSPEPLFLAGIIASVYYFKHKKFWLAGIWGAIAQLTKSPAILLFVAYTIALALPALQHAAQTSIKNIFKKVEWRAYPVVLIPFALLAIFLLYRQPFTFNDFFAYFNSGDNIHLFFPPFQIFNYSQPWVQTHWLEEIIFVYLFGFYGLLQLIKQKKLLLASFVGVYFISTIFVSHRDLIRYSLPIIPFLFSAYHPIIIKPEFKYVMLFLLIPIYLFSLAYISQNFMQIADWGPLL